MKQIAIISGKGGSGKTSISSSFISLTQKSIICDCDVEAPNLHLLLKPKNISKTGFYGINKAFINKNRCIECNNCIKYCRFSAINKDYEVEKTACEGCTACKYICPTGAVQMDVNQAGNYFKSDTIYGTMFHAELNIGEKNSGKLVALLREKAREAAYEEKVNLVIIDGPPGIGCPVIATLSGVDLAVIITEPTSSAIHDMLRVIELCKHFNIKHGIIINKQDINPDKAQEIKTCAAKNNIPIFGELPFDSDFRKAVNSFAIPVNYSGHIRENLSLIWQKIQSALNQ